MVSGALMLTGIFPIGYLAVDYLNEITFGGKKYSRVIVDKEETRYPNLYVLKSDAEELTL
jgi:hypothetical protein